MEFLVALLDAVEDVNGLLRGRLLHHDRLEAPLQGGVLLDVLAVLVQRRGANAAELTAGQGGLQDVARVHRALGGPRPHQCVQLVQEHDDVPLRGADLVHHPLHPLLELAAVLGAGHESCQVQGHQTLVGQQCRHRSVGDLLRQPLGYGGLAHARVADQAGVVLGPATEDLRDPLELLVSADGRVELSLTGQHRQVTAVLVELGGTALLLGLFARRGLRVARHAVADARELHAVLAQQAVRGAAAFMHQAYKDVLSADMLVLQSLRLGVGDRQDALGLRREGQLPVRLL